MNAGDLLRHYETVADGPDAVRRLRSCILDLAVRGKLTQQRTAAESAKALIARLGLQVNSAAVEPFAGGPLAFDLPGGWSWVNLGAVTETITSGSRDWAQHYSDQGAIFVRMGNLSKDSYALRLDSIQRVQAPESGEGRRTRLEAGDLLVSITGDVGMLGLVPDGFGEAYINQHTCLVRFLPELRGRYFPEVLRSSLARAQFNAPQRGIKNSFRLGDVGEMFVPLPPVEEQHRIVAKVDELMALCDRLEAARAQREAARDRLAAASLARLNAPDPETFVEDARFALDALPALTARPDQIKQLRQTILNLAVRGKLVPQVSADAAPVNLDAALPKELERPFDIPKTWRWARLRYLGKLVGGGTPSKARDDFWDGPIPWVSPKDMKVDYVTKSQLGIQPAAIMNSPANLIDPGSILFVVRGMILAHSFPVAVAHVPLTINQDMKALILRIPEMAEFLLRLLKGLKPEVLQRVQRSTHGTCRLEGTAYSDLLLPIPPAAEQHRIVAKVDELMALCDRLEASLKQADEHRRRLLEALLHEALQPAAAPEEQAA